MWNLNRRNRWKKISAFLFPAGFVVAKSHQNGIEIYQQNRIKYYRKYLSMYTRDICKYMSMVLVYTSQNQAPSTPILKISIFNSSNNRQRQDEWTSAGPSHAFHNASLLKGRTLFTNPHRNSECPKPYSAFHAAPALQDL